jgi:hypothetical protein
MKRRTVVAVCAVVALVLGATLVVTQAPGKKKKHKHEVVMVYNQVQVVTPPNDVASGTVFCPPGTLATGGGEDFAEGLATVDMGFVGTNAYYLLVDNFDNSFRSVLTVQVACTAGTSKAKARSLTRAQIKDKVAAKAAALEAAHRAAE